ENRESLLSWQLRHCSRRLQRHLHGTVPPAAPGQLRDERGDAGSLRDARRSNRCGARSRPLGASRHDVRETPRAAAGSLGELSPLNPAVRLNSPLFEKARVAMADLKVLGICGSLRKASFNMAALLACNELLPAGMTLQITSIADIPM